MVSSYVCYNCLSENTSKIGVLPDFDHDVIRCNECGLVQSEFLSKEYLENYYKKKYRTTRNEKINDDYIEFMKKRAFSQKQFIKKYCKIPNNCKIVDLGAGVGELLLSFLDECKQLYAIEYDLEMKNYLRDISEINLIGDDYLICEKYKKYFDFVFLSHVFEHLNDPREYLRKIHKIICDNGYLFIEVPNETVEIVKSYVKNRKKGLGHLFFYDTKTIKNILTVFNLFEIVSIDTYGISVQDYLTGRSTFDSFETNTDGIYVRCLLKKNNGRFENEDRSRYYRSNCEKKDFKLQQYQEDIINLQKLEKENLSLRKENVMLRESYSFKIGHLILSPIKYFKGVLNK